MDPKVLALAALGMGTGFFIQQKLSGGGGEKEVDTELMKRVAAFEWAESDFNFEATLKHALWISKHVLDTVEQKLKQDNYIPNFQWGKAADEVKAYAKKVLSVVWPDNIYKKVFPEGKTEADFQQLSRYIAAPAIGALIGYRARFPPDHSDLVKMVDLRKMVEAYIRKSKQNEVQELLLAAVQVVQIVFKAVDPEQRVENLSFLSNGLVDWGFKIIPVALKEGSSSELQKSFNKAYAKYAEDVNVAAVGVDGGGDAIFAGGDNDSQNGDDGQPESKEETNKPQPNGGGGQSKQQGKQKKRNKGGKK